MKYGAKMLQWAPFAQSDPEPAGALPKYGTPINLGALNKVTDSPSFNEAKGYGDNALKVHVVEFKEAGIDVEVNELANTAASAIFGAKLDDEDAQDLHFGSEDNPPYGGLGFYISKMLEGNVKVYQGIYYPKVKASMQGEEYSTKGESITLANSKIHFLASACNSGDWQIKSKDFPTETEATDWVNEKIKASGV